MLYRLATNIRDELGQVVLSEGWHGPESLMGAIMMRRLRWRATRGTDCCPSSRKGRLVCRWYSRPQHLYALVKPKHIGKPNWFPRHGNPCNRQLEIADMLYSQMYMSCKEEA